MNLTPRQIEGLVSAIGLTRDAEIDCDECLSRIAEFAEHELTGMPTPEVMADLVRHLNLCAECGEEYEELKKAISELEAG